MKIISTLFFSLLTIFSFGQEVNTLEKPEVDSRIELLSIVFRLAGNKEYSSNNFKLYADRIENYFSAYKNHGLIQFVKKISKENNIG